MNRRALFSFLAASPVVAVGEIARATQPATLEVDKLKVGGIFEIGVNEKGTVVMKRTDASDGPPAFTISQPPKLNFGGNHESFVGTDLAARGYD
jgi:hypothetical protein